jgi:hypothetical protein
MRSYTDKFFEAWQAGAKPIALAYLNIDDTLYCFGKQTPLEAWLQASTFFWEARVLTFGTFTQELSTDSSDVFQTLTEKPMDSYSVTFDNADGYFSLLAAQHNLLAGTLSLYLGYEYPGFAAADFRRLFFGKISTLKWARQTAVITAQQAMTPIEPESPVVDTTKTYALSAAGSGETAGSGTFSTAEISPVFFDPTSILFQLEFLVDSGDCELLRLEDDNTGTDRLVIGVDASLQPYISINTAAPGATPNIVTATVPASLSTGTVQNISMLYNKPTGLVTVTDSQGNTYEIWLKEWVKTYSNSVSTGYYYQMAYSAYDNKIYVADGASYIDVYTDAGVYESSIGGPGLGDGQFYSAVGVAVDPLGYVYVADSSNQSIQVLTPGGVFVRKWNTGPASPLVGIRGLCYSNGYIYAVSRSAFWCAKWTTTGSYVSKWGTKGSGDGQFDTPIGICADAHGNIYISEGSPNCRISAFTSDGGFLGKVSITGISTPYLACFGNRLFIPSSNEIYIFSTLLKYESTLIMSSVSYDSCAAWETDKVFTVSNTGTVEFQEWEFQLVAMDTTDDGDNNLIAGNELDGNLFRARTDSGLDLYNSANDSGATTLVDNAGTLDLAVVDGTWEEWGTVDVMQENPLAELPLTGFETLPLVMAGSYPYCSDSHQNVFLPLPYGNLRENSAAGVYVAPLIDAPSFVYCVAGFPIQSVADGNNIAVYIDGVRTLSGWTFDEDDDFLGQGNIATLTFTSDPGGEVTVSVFSGPDNGSGVSLTNPVDILNHLLTFASESMGATSWTKDEGSFAQVKALSTRLRYTCAGVIQASQSLNYWIQSILKGFLGWYTFNADGLLEIGMTDISANNPQTFATLNEYDAISASATQDDQSLCNALTINYAIAYTEIDRRYKNAGDPSYYVTEEVASTTQSAAIYGTQQKDLNFDWTRNTYTVQRVAEYLLAQYNTPQIFVEYEGQDFLAAPLELRDYVNAEWSFVLDQDGESSEEVWELRSKNLDLDNFTNRVILKKNKTDIPALYDFVYIGEDRVYIGDDPVAILR